MGTILIIDDEHDLLAILEKKLRTNGHEVFVADNGRQALGGDKPCKKLGSRDDEGDACGIDQTVFKGVE